MRESTSVHLSTISHSELRYVPLPLQRPKTETSFAVTVRLPYRKWVALRRILHNKGIKGVDASRWLEDLVDMYSASM